MKRKDFTFKSSCFSLCRAFFLCALSKWIEPPIIWKHAVETNLNSEMTGYANSTVTSSLPRTLSFNICCYKVLIPIVHFALFPGFPLYWFNHSVFFIIWCLIAVFYWAHFNAASSSAVLARENTDTYNYFSLSQTLTTVWVTVMDRNKHKFEFHLANFLFIC